MNRAVALQFQYSVLEAMDPGIRPPWASPYPKEMDLPMWQLFPQRMDAEWPTGVCRKRVAVPAFQKVYANFDQ